MHAVGAGSPRSYMPRGREASNHLRNRAKPCERSLPGRHALVYRTVWPTHDECWRFTPVSKRGEAGHAGAISHFEPSLFAAQGLFLSLDRMAPEEVASVFGLEVPSPPDHTGREEPL